MTGAPGPSKGRRLAPSLLLLLLASAACSSGPEERRPAWVDGTSARFPVERYLVGLGEADSRPAATARAYEAVARVFEAQVTAQARDWESYVQLDNPGGTSHERRLTIERVTKVSTDKVLETVQVLDAWLDRASGIHYVLAGMNRAQGEAVLVDRIRELDGTIEEELARAAATRDRLTTLRNLKRATDHQVLREAFNADLRVLRPSGRGEPAAHHVAGLTAKLEAYLASNLVIGVEVSGDEAEAVRRAVLEGLVRQGLPVTDDPLNIEAPPHDRDDPAPLPLLVRGTARLRRAAVPDPMFAYVRWCADFVLLDVQTARVVGVVSRRGREGHVTESEARTRAVRVMEQEITAELAVSLAEYVYGDGGASGDVTAPAACAREIPEPEAALIIHPFV